jgi:antitoxin ParD1/3/4
MANHCPGGYDAPMTVTLTLTPEQEAWVSAHVTSGDFPSVEAAVRQLLAEGMAGYEHDMDDLAWAKPYVDEALAELERGEGIPLDEHEAYIDALMAKLKAE